MEPKKKPVRPLEQRIEARERKQEAMNRKRNRTIARKMKRKPADWGFEEKSNPDHEWLEFLRDYEEKVGKPPRAVIRNRVAGYLRMTRKFKTTPEEPLNRWQRIAMRKIIGDYLRLGGYVPKEKLLKKIYDFCKCRKKKELETEPWK